MFGDIGQKWRHIRSFLQYFSIADAESVACDFEKKYFSDVAWKLKD